MASILLIEDTEDTRIALRRLLEIDCHEVMAAADGEAGYFLATQFKPHIIVTDFMMPRLDGINLSVRVRNNSLIADTGIILMSAFSEDIDMILAAGADVYLQKPFDYDQLAEAIVTLDEARFGLKTAGTQH